MIGGIGCREDDQSVERRQKPLDAVLHLLITQFEMATILLLPIFVKINQNIDSPVQLEAGVFVESGMILEQTTTLDFMKAASAIVGISDQLLFDACQLLQKFQEGFRVEIVHQLADLRTE